MTEKHKSLKKSAPYIPFKTFTGFTDRLHSTATPPIIDGSLLHTMGGSMKSQLLSALRFMNLIDSNNVVLEPMKTLIKSYKTDSWKNELTGIIMSSYEHVVKNVDVDNGTAQQLDDAFRKYGEVDGQDLEKSVRFYLAALQECGLSYSPHFKVKRPRKPKKPKDNKLKPPFKEDPDDDLPDDDGSNGSKRAKFNIAIPGKKPATIYIPSDIDEDDWEMVKIMLDAYVNRLTSNTGDQ